MNQVVSFVANAGPPPSGNRVALKVLAWVLGGPSAAAVAYVAFMNAGFLAGSAASPLGQIAGVIAGIAAALGLSLLLVAIGITRKDMPPVAIMASVLFLLCLWLSLSAAGGFAFFTSQRMPAGHMQEYDGDPRQMTAIEREIERFRLAPREYHVGGHWWIATGDEILSKTRKCSAPRLPWESTQCWEWAYLQRERAERMRLDGASQGGGFDPTEMFSREALTFGRYYSAGLTHLLIVAFASIGGAIVFGCAYVLMTPPAISAAAPLVPVNGKTPTEQAFETWAGEYVVKDTGADTPSALLYLCYQLVCAQKGWPEYADADAFGRKLKPWAQAKHQSVETEKSNGRMVYVGVNLKPDAISEQARRSLENGGGA